MEKRTILYYAITRCLVYGALGGLVQYIQIGGFIVGREQPLQIMTSSGATTGYLIHLSSIWEPILVILLLGFIVGWVARHDITQIIKRGSAMKVEKPLNEK